MTEHNLNTSEGPGDLQPDDILKIRIPMAVPLPHSLVRPTTSMTEDGYLEITFTVGRTGEEST